MPDLRIHVAGVDASVRSLTPLLNFKVRITADPAAEVVQAVLLNAQIQLQPAQRRYTADEQRKLVELFGPPEVWGQTLRNRLWANVNATIGAFSGSVEAALPVQCTCDMSLAATKYFYALDEGEASLLFLFSGSVFYTSAEGRIQVAPISWNQESVFRMPVREWRAVMERHYPNAAWLTLERNVFDQLCQYKREKAIPTWEETIAQLLRTAEGSEQSTSREAVTATGKEAVA